MFLSMSRNVINIFKNSFFKMVGVLVTNKIKINKNDFFISLISAFFVSFSLLSTLLELNAPFKP